MRSNESALFVTNIPTPYRQAVYTALSEGFAQVGYSFEVVYFAEREPNRKWHITETSYQYKYAFVGSRLRKLGVLETYVSLWPFVKWVLTRPRITILAGAWHYPANLLILLASRALGAKCYFWCESNAASDKTKGRLAALMRALFYRLCNYYIVPGAQSELYVRRLNSRSHVVYAPNAVEHVYFNLPYQRLIAPRNRYSFICVAELSQRKGVLQAAEVVAQLIKDKELPSTTRLDVVGTGDDLAKLQRFAKAHPWLKVHGHKQGRELLDIWLNSSALILNTALDPSPLVVNEAITLGLIPIVSTRAGNSDEVSAVCGEMSCVFEYGELPSGLKRYAALSDSDVAQCREILLESSSKYKSEQVAAEIIMDAISEIANAK